MNKVILLLSTIIISVAFAGSIAFGATTYRNIQSQSIKNLAVDGCLKSSVYRNTVTTANGSSTTTEEAISTSVDRCMKLKGY